jgi:hypothetical protein
MESNRYNVEYVSAETGETETKSGLKRIEVDRIVLHAQPGDAIVINVTEGW